MQHCSCPASESGIKLHTCCKRSWRLKGAVSGAASDAAEASASGEAPQHLLSIQMFCFATCCLPLQSSLLSIPSFLKINETRGILSHHFFSFSKKRSEKNLASLNWKGMNNTILITVPWITFQSCPSDNFHALRSSASLLLLKNYTHSYFSCLPSSFLSFFLAQHIK